MKRSYIIAGIVVLVGVFSLIQTGLVRDLLLLHSYARFFDADALDENFRTAYANQPSLKVDRSPQATKIIEDLQPFPMPATFDFQEKTSDTRDFLEEMNTTGLAIMKDGKLIYENYDRGNDQNSLAMQMSVSKTFTAFLAGVAIEKGDISSKDDYVTDYVPALEGTAYDGVRVVDLLDMSSGIQWREDMGDLSSELVRSIKASAIGSLDDFAKTMKRVDEPGTFHRYASIDTHILAMVIRGATGKPFEAYFKEEVWDKIGAESDAYFLTDATGEPLAGGGMNISLRDMLRFGSIFANEGKSLSGEQLISTEWIDGSTVPDHPRLEPGPDNPLSSSYFGYKHHWWIPEDYDDEFVAIGIYGQFIYVNRKHSIVIVKTSAYKNFLKDGGWRTHETVTLFRATVDYLSKQTM